MLVADILSRSYIKDESIKDNPEMAFVVHCIYIPLSPAEKQEFQKAIDEDKTLSQVKQYCQSGWPNTDEILSNTLKFYYNLRDNICLSNDLLFFEPKIIVPLTLRLEMMKMIYKLTLAL